MGIPFLSIDYTGREGKVSALLRRIGYGRFSEPWDGMDVTRAEARLNELWEDHAHWSDYLRGHAQEMVSDLAHTYSKVFGVPPG